MSSIHSSIHTVTVTVPATTANLGPGFDCIGAALTLYNQFKFTRLGYSPTEEGRVVRIKVSGLEAEKVAKDDSNLIYQAFVKFYKHIGHAPPPVQIEIDLNVPLSRGLGSSATAIVGGLVGANQLAGTPLSQVEVMKMAIAIEGHPDNVVPALLGGCRLAATSDLEEWEICDISWHSDIGIVVAIPNFELSTAEARRVLPTEYSRADAVFNIAHFGLLVRGLETGRGDWLRVGMQDKIHQPYREGLIPGYAQVRSAALQAGAYGMAISGAGPTLLALVSEASASAVSEAIATAWQEEGINADVRSLSIDNQGALSVSS